MHTISAADSSTGSEACTSDVESRLLKLFQQTMTLSNDPDSEDGPYYNLTLTWDPTWGIKSWKSLGCLVNAKELNIKGKGLAHSLPDSFVSVGAFPRLQKLRIVNSSLSGVLPDSWAQPGAFPRLRSLVLRNNSLSGPLPSGVVPARSLSCKACT